MMLALRNYFNTFKWQTPRPLTYDKFSFFSPNIFFFPINFLLIIITLILNWVCKSFLINFNYKFIYFINFIKNRTCLKNFKTTSKDCYIIGNGSSLKTSDLLFLKNKITFTVNNFQETKNFSPTYHVILDGTFFLQWKSYLKKKIKLSKNTFFFIPSTEKKEFKSLNSKIIYFDLLPYPVEEYLPSNINFKSGIPWTFNVIPFSILLAISLGFKKIKILGVTQAQLLKGKHYVTRKKYFSGVKLKREFDEKIRRYRFGSGRTNMMTMWSNYRIYLAYDAISNFAKKNKISIFNVSKDGYLDTFDYKKLKKN